jgi:hypothetical protein
MSREFDWRELMAAFTADTEPGCSPIAAQTRRNHVGSAHRGPARPALTPPSARAAGVYGDRGKKVTQTDSPLQKRLQRRLRGRTAGPVTCSSRSRPGSGARTDPRVGAGRAGNQLSGGWSGGFANSQSTCRQDDCAEMFVDYYYPCEAGVSKTHGRTMVSRESGQQRRNHFGG